MNQKQTTVTWQHDEPYSVSDVVANDICRESVLLRKLVATEDLNSKAAFRGRGCSRRGDGYKPEPDPRPDLPDPSQVAEKKEEKKWLR